MASQLAKNYTNWTSEREVMATLVEWCKGTPLDTTIYREALYNNKHGDGKVDWLVVSLT